MDERDLKTRRLRLRPCAEDELEALHALWTEREVRRWFWDGRAIVAQEMAAVEASQGSFSDSDIGIWSIFSTDTHEFVGMAGLLVRSHRFFDLEIPPQERVGDGAVLRSKVRYVFKYKSRSA